MAAMRLRTLVCCGETCRFPAFLDLRGLLSFWLLWELRLGSLRGAQLSERMRWRRGDALSPGTLYPALRALEARRLVRKHRAGRDTAYEITRPGRRELDCAAGFLRVVVRDVVEA